MVIHYTSARVSYTARIVQCVWSPDDSILCWGWQVHTSNLVWSFRCTVSYILKLWAGIRKICIHLTARILGREDPLFYPYLKLFNTRVILPFSDQAVLCTCRPKLVFVVRNLWKKYLLLGYVPTTDFDTDSASKSDFILFPIHWNGNSAV